MKKHIIKTVLCCVLAAIMLISSTAFAIGGEEDVSAKTSAIDVFTDFKAQYGGILPDNYAGSYYENGKLVVMLAPSQIKSSGSVELAKAQIMSEIGAPNEIIYREAIYTEADLEARLEKYVAELKEHFAVTSYWVGDKQNKAVIGILPADYAAAQEYVSKNMPDEPLMLVEEEYEKNCCNEPLRW